ncbi:DUF5994 family protein [Sphaerisporangium dianthi]|uniref:DUF5994 family protein n=1 Tax=Sphaerisporangium dianthi TaxID=1436120 RepID=A0ABV9CQU1_9ACTN
MTSALVSHLKPLSTAASAVPAVDSSVRLSLDPPLNRRAPVDGVWWPRSRDAAAELPGLVAAVDQRLGRTTLRVGVYRDAWDDIPRRITNRGRQIRVGWFRSSDPRVITLIFAAGEPVVLSVAEQGTTPGPTEAAPRLTTQDTTTENTTTENTTIQDTTGPRSAGVSSLAPLPTSPAPRTAEADNPAGWENEGGSTDRAVARPTG